LVKRIVFGCSVEFLPFDNDGYITPLTTEGTAPVPLNAPVLNAMGSYSFFWLWRNAQKKVFITLFGDSAFACVPIFVASPAKRYLWNKVGN